MTPELKNKIFWLKNSNLKYLLFVLVISLMAFAQTFGIIRFIK